MLSPSERWLAVQTLPSSWQQRGNADRSVEEPQGMGVGYGYGG